VWASFMVLYGTERYFIEFLRGDPGRGEVFNGLMTGTQLISILLVIGGGVIWWLKSGKSSTQQSALSIQKTGSAL
jgi:prolipoprotein diacylglyceryltransferase